MSIPSSHTAHGDAPLSAAKNPDAHAELGELKPGEVLVGRSVTINRPREELYAFGATSPICRDSCRTCTASRSGIRRVPHGRSKRPPARPWSGTRKSPKTIPAV